jgi:digeranylgeranylglycerophospholipid reductase
VRCDIVVVGAGPGGSSAALQAARGGADVLLLEKRQEIGSPVRCAEGVSKRGLERCGIKADKRWIAAEMKGAKLHSPDDTIVELSEELAGNEVGFVLERKIFDRELAAMASDAGVEILLKTMAVDLTTDGEGARLTALREGDKIKIDAEVVIAADGIESKVARWAGIDTTLKPSDVESCFQYLIGGVECDRDYTHFYIGSFYSPGGYVWVFPKGGSKANVGIGVQTSKIPRHERGYARRLLDDFISKHTSLAKGKKLEMVVGGVPVSGPKYGTVGDRLMVVGDAARHSDPATGGGIINAIRGGKLAGEVGAQAVREHDPSREFLLGYERAWRGEFGGSLERDLIVKDLLTGLSDWDLDDLAHSLSGHRFEDLLGLIEAIREKHPLVAGGLR